MTPLPRGVHRLLITPLSRGPAVELIAAEDLIPLGVDTPDKVTRWCTEHEALYHEEAPERFALDVTAAYALGKGFLRCVFRR